MSTNFQLLKSAIEDLILFFTSRAARLVKINLDLEAQINAFGSEKDALINALREESQAKGFTIERLSGELAQCQSALIGALADDIASAEAQKLAAIALSDSNTEIEILKQKQAFLEVKVIENEAIIAKSLEDVIAAQAVADTGRLELASQQGDLDSLIQLAQSAIAGDADLSASL